MNPARKKRVMGQARRRYLLSALIGKCYGTIRARGLLSTRYVVAACVPCADVYGTPKRGKRTVYADVAVLVGNIDGGFTGAIGNNARYTLASGVKATIGMQRGKNAVELGYTGLYNNPSESLVRAGLFRSVSIPVSTRTL